MLPISIRTYFDADGRNDGEALVAAFSPDAIVEDEGRSRTGHHAIQVWSRETKDKYQHVIEPLDWTEEQGVHRVRARVTGDFPGSPATLIFAFRLQGDRIAQLKIGA